MKTQDQDTLLQTLKRRFDKHMQRHLCLSWADVQARLQGQAAALKALQAMEATGGEPDVIALDAGSEQVTFFDCSAQSPAGRRSACYDGEALRSRKENRPAHSVVELAAEMGVKLLTEDQYRQLQTLGEFDTTTSSWISTPAAVRERGGALFCDRRYGQVFTYHNGAQSYYAARGFRAWLQV